MSIAKKLIKPLKRHGRNLNAHYFVKKPQRTLLCKETNVKGYISYDSTYRTFWKRQEQWRQYKDLWLTGVVEEIDEKPEHNGFLRQ